MRKNDPEAGQKIHLGDLWQEFPGPGSQESRQKSKHDAVSGSPVIGISIPLEKKSNKHVNVWQKKSNKHVNVWQIGKNCYEKDICPPSRNGIISETSILNS
jgi:hypothetical protein